MKKNLIALITIVASLSLTGCSFFNFITSSDSSEIYDWEPVTQKLAVTQKDLTPVHYQEIDTMPSTGNPKLLVLPIAFTDSSDFITEEDKVTISEKLEKVCFGTNEDTGWYSISSFYNAESYGKCNITGEVAPWFNTTYRYDRVDGDTTETIVKDAVNEWKRNNPDKVKDYDTDGNGYLDGVIAIYGGPNYSNTDKLKRHKQNTNMWAYTSWLKASANEESPNGNVFIWASYDFMDSDLSGDVKIDGHTYIHEMGHVFGLDDYYDYADQGIWAGGYSMQDYNVGGHDPYSALSLGWVEPYVPTGNATITIRPFESSGDLILLSPDFTANSAFDEYVLLELYSPTGVNLHDSEYQYMNKYPLGPNKMGIRIWHVDARLLKIKESKRGLQTVESYSITNTIDPNDGTYIVGCTNTTYVRGKEDSNKYTTLAGELRQYKLLELIRRSDYSHSLTSETLNNNYLFKEGDGFTLSTYTGYFLNGSKLNNDAKFNWKVKIESVTSSEAKIIVTL